MVDYININKKKRDGKQEVQEVGDTLMVLKKTLAENMMCQSPTILHIQVDLKSLAPLYALWLKLGPI